MRVYQKNAPIEGSSLMHLSAEASEANSIRPYPLDFPVFLSCDIL